MAWQQVYSDDNTPFWYNFETGESSATNPENQDVEGWIQTAQGWYNPATQEFSQTQPEPSVAPTQSPYYSPESTGTLADALATNPYGFDYSTIEGTLSQTNTAGGASGEGYQEGATTYTDSAGNPVGAQTDANWTPTDTEYGQVWVNSATGETTANQPGTTEADLGQLYSWQQDETARYLARTIQDPNALLAELVKSNIDLRRVEALGIIPTGTIIQTANGPLPFYQVVNQIERAQSGGISAGEAMAQIGVFVGAAALGGLGSTEASTGESVYGGMDSSSIASANYGYPTAPTAPTGTGPTGPAGPGYPTRPDAGGFFDNATASTGGTPDVAPIENPAGSVFDPLDTAGAPIDTGGYVDPGTGPVPLESLTTGGGGLTTGETIAAVGAGATAADATGAFDQTGSTGTGLAPGEDPYQSPPAQLPANSPALSRILNGTATEADWLSVLGTGAATTLGLIGSREQTEALERLANQYMELGAPSRARFEASYQPGFTMRNDPGYTAALDDVANSTLRGLSVQGNPFGNPSAWDTTLNTLYNRTAYPALQNYRSMNANAGGLSRFAEAAPGAATSAINSNSNTYNVLGGAVADLTQPRRTTLADIYRSLA